MYSLKGEGKYKQYVRHNAFYTQPPRLSSLQSGCYVICTAVSPL